MCVALSAANVGTVRHTASKMSEDVCMRNNVLQFTALMLFILNISIAAAQTALYMAPDGNNQSAGTFEHPFATLERAREEIRSIKKQGSLPTGGITVYLRGGNYPLTESFELTAADSGTEQAPINYRAYEQEEVHITGGREISGFVPVDDQQILCRLDPTARTHVYQLDLSVLGITNFGQLKPRGFPQAILPTALELFFNEQPMTLARWPNDGYATTGKVIEPGTQKSNGNKPVDSGSAPKAGIFKFDLDRIERWADADDVWMHGFWCWDWADEYVRVAKIDPATNTVHLAIPHTYGYKEGRRFYVRNVLKELDAPGEYYLDRKTGWLYFYPPAPIDEGHAVVSLLETPLIKLRNVSHIEFRNLTLECGRGDGITVEGGDHISVRQCTLCNLGNRAITISNGSLSGIRNCQIYNTGEGCISIGGGDRITLSGGKVRVSQNDIHHFNRLTKTYRPAISFSGVGHVVTHNRIHDAPHSAVIFGSANDCEISYNDIFNVCTESEDAGAIYTGRDWTVQGISISHNFIHHIRGTTNTGRQGIYIDDAAGGMRIFGNVLCDIQRAILIGGGRDNRIENNIFVDCNIPVHIDNRGMNWMSYHVAEGGIMRERLNTVPYQSPLWNEHYPRLCNILADEPAIPKRNVVRNNLLVKCGQLEKHIASVAREYGTVADNLITSEDPGFIGASRLNFQLRQDSVIWKTLPDFQSIPFDSIGPCNQTPKPVPTTSDS